MSIFAYTVYINLKDTTVPHINQLTDDLIVASRDITELIILEVEGNGIRISRGKVNGIKGICCKKIS